MVKQKDKDRINIVYSTNPDFKYEFNEVGQTDTLPNQQQNLRVMIDRKQRAGKVVTLVTGFIGKTEDLEKLGKTLKTNCGVGGTVKDGQILLQGEFCDRIIGLLSAEGYKVKKSGGL
jgi:translation initiation factor 1